MQSNALTGEMKMKRSLNVHSNKSSIAIDTINTKKAQPLSGTMTFTNSEYGVMSSKQEKSSAQNQQIG